MAGTKNGAIIFLNEIDATGGARGDIDAFGNNEVQRTMLENNKSIRWFFDALMATSGPDTDDELRATDH